MLSKSTQIFASFHKADERLVQSAMERLRESDWKRIIVSDNHASVSELISQSGIVLVFLSKDFVRDDHLMLEEFAYASVVVRKAFLPVWLENLEDIRLAHNGDRQLLSSLEMLTAKHPSVTIEKLIAELEEYEPDNPPYTPSVPQICEKPCEAYEGNEPYIFISYAHDDAKRVYPIVKELYEAGWDLWYDEGIKTTERYLPVIADNLNRCAAVVLMLTNRCLERPFVMNYELEYARQLDVPIIPVLLEELYPPEYALEAAAELLKDALAPDALISRVAGEALPNRGEREAVPPAVKQNVVYDVVLPPEIPGFTYTVQGDTINIIEYVGNDKIVVVPEKIAVPNSEMTFYITSIDRNAFWECKHLREIVIPEGVKSIGEYAFCRCYSLSRIIMNKGIESIDRYAFYNCESLFEIIIPEGMRSIGERAFASCYSLTNVVLPKNYVDIADNAFEGTPIKTIKSNLYEDVKESNSMAQKMANIVPPCCDEQFSLLCCAEEDLPLISPLLIELYWEGFNIRYDANPNQQILNESQCILAFFSNQTASSTFAMETLKKAIHRGASYIIQVFLGDCTEWPDELRDKLRDRLAIIQKDSTELAFMGRIRDSLRHFDCSLDHPRGFVVKDLGDSVEITKFSPADFPIVKIPKTFFNPPLPVSSIGEEAFDSCESIESVFLPEGIIDIGNRAFRKCTSLINVNIPNSVENIGIEAFSHCNSLANVTIPNSVKNIEDMAFSYCKSLREQVIPKNVIRIGFCAFEGCKSLRNVTVGDNVEIIMDGAFKDCISLQNIVIPQKVQHVNSLTFSGCRALTKVVLPEELTRIGEEAFKDCQLLAQVDMSMNVTDIDDRALQGCESLKSFVIPKGIKSIGKDILSGCTQLNTVFNEDSTILYHYNGNDQTKIYSVPDGVVTICGEFTNCRPLTNVVIPKSVEKIEQNVFSQCKSLEEISVDEKNSIYSSYDGALYTKDMVTLVLCPPGKVEFTFPNGVTHIGAFAFANCESLVSITIPESVTSIGNGAFQECKALSGVNIPQRVTKISDWVFAGCKSLTDVQIPEGVQQIGVLAFSSCPSLKSLVVPKSVTSIGMTAFGSCDSLTVYTPEDSYAWRYAKADGTKREPLKKYKSSNKTGIFSHFLKRGN